MPPPPPAAGVFPVEVTFRPEELAAAWRPEARRLLLTVREPLPLRQKVAVRIGAIGVAVTATITGRVASARRHGGAFRIELEPDETRVRAVERLVAIARGEKVEYEARAPRLLATVPAVIYAGRGPTYMTTFAVSENGCGLTWSGPLPQVGVPIEVRLGAGRQLATVCGEVCWTGQSGRTPTVGMRFIAGERTAWAAMLVDLR